MAANGIRYDPYHGELACVDIGHPLMVGIDQAFTRSLDVALTGGWNTHKW